MKYYIDIAFVDLDNNLQPKDCYTSIYSGLSKECNQIHLDQKALIRINELAYEELVNFYNHFDSYFIEREKIFGINIWFLEQFRLFFKYRNLMQRVESIKQFIENNPEGMIITRDRHIALFFNSEKIIFNSSKKKGVNLGRLLNEFWLIFRQFKWKEEGKNETLIMPKWVGADIESDFRFGKLTNIYDQSTIRELFNLKKPLESFRKNNSSRYNSDQILIKYLFSFDWLKKLPKFKSTLETLKESINNEIEHLTIEKKIISNLFFSSNGSYLLYFIRFCAYQQYFKESGIKNVIISDENSPQQKVIQYAANSLNINSFGLQHGAIYDYHMAYTFKGYHHKPILPTNTFLWGNYFKEVLLDSGGYERNQISVVGRVSPKKVDRIDTIKKTSGKKNILYASQPQPDENLRRQQVFDVLSVAKEMGLNYNLIIRPHPAERNDSYFIDIGSSIGYDDFVIDRESDMLTQFEACDLLITAYSTVGIEFVPQFKPLLVLDYLKQDIVGYIKRGVGIEITNQEELLNVLKLSKIDISNKAYEGFIVDYFYKLDNRAADRIMEIVNGHRAEWV